MPVNPSRLVTLRGLESYFPDHDGSPLFPEATVRGWIHSNLDRFKATCVVKPGGRIFIDLDAFAAWLEERRGAPSDRISASHRQEVRLQKTTREEHPIRQALTRGRQARSRLD